VAGSGNENSIACGSARALKDQGAQLAVTYLNEKAKPYVALLAEELGAEIFLPLDVQNEDRVAALYAQITENLGAAGYASPFDCLCAPGRSPWARGRQFG